MYRNNKVIRRYSEPLKKKHEQIFTITCIDNIRNFKGF